MDDISDELSYKCMQIYNRQHLSKLITMNNKYEIEKDKIVYKLYYELGNIRTSYKNKEIKAWDFKDQTVDCLLKYGIVVDETVLKSYMRKHMLEDDDCGGLYYLN